MCLTSSEWYSRKTRTGAENRNDNLQKLLLLILDSLPVRFTKPYKPTAYPKPDHRNGTSTFESRTLSTMPVVLLQYPSVSHF